jgi:hypothetical protein
MLADTEKRTNQKGASNVVLPALRDLGIAKMQSHCWQAMARVPEALTLLWVAGERGGPGSPLGQPDAPGEAW